MAEVRQAAVPAADPEVPDSGANIGARRLATWGFAAAALLTGLWAVFQNFYKLGTAPILADEPTYIETAWRYVHGQVHPVVSSGSTLIGTPDNFEHPPLAKYLFGVAQLIDGTPSSLPAARAVCALATVLAGVAVAVWIGRAAGRWIGLGAGPRRSARPDVGVPRRPEPDPAALGVLTMALGAREVPPQGRPHHLGVAHFDQRFRSFLAIVVVFTLGNSSDAFLILRARRRGCRCSASSA